MKVVMDYETKSIKMRDEINSNFDMKIITQCIQVLRHLIVLHEYIKHYISVKHF
jgi:hypothetical protein